MNPALVKTLRLHRTHYTRAIRLPEGGREAAAVAYRIATALGHLPLRQGSTVECARCGKSGRAAETLTGAVHTEVCS